MCGLRLDSYKFIDLKTLPFLNVIIEDLWEKVLTSIKTSCVKAKP